MAEQANHYVTGADKLNYNFIKKAKSKIDYSQIAVETKIVNDGKFKN